MKKLFFFLTFVLILGMSSYATAGGPGDDPRCDGLTGAAKGLCFSANAIGCDDPTTRKPGCDKIDETYITITGSPPPWSECPCFSAATFDMQVYDLRIYEPDYGCVNEVGEDWLATAIVNGDADYQASSGYNHNYWGNMCSHVDLNYIDGSIDPFGLWVENITYEEAVACRDIILNSEMWALNCINPH